MSSQNISPALRAHQLSPSPLGQLQSPPPQTEPPSVERPRGRSPLPSPLAWETSAGPSPALEPKKSPPASPAAAPRLPPVPMSFTGQDLVTGQLQTGPKMARLYRLLGLSTHQDTAARINNLHLTLGPQIDTLLQDRLGWTPCLSGLEIEFVRRDQVRPYLGFGTRFWSVQGVARRALSFFSSHVYSPLMPSQSKEAEATLKSRGRLLLVLPNAWWLSQSQLTYQLVQALTLVSVHQNAPATYNHLAFMGSSEIFEQPRNGLGAVMHGLGEVMAHKFVPEAQKQQRWYRPFDWFNARTRSQRLAEGLLRFIIPDMLQPQRLGRKHRFNMAHVLENDATLLDRSLRFPCASIGLTATPDPRGTPLDFDHEAAQGNYGYEQAERDVMHWEQFNPSKGAIRYFQPQSQLRAP